MAIKHHTQHPFNFANGARLLFVALLVSGLFTINGCQAVVGAVSSGFADDLSEAILNNDDLHIVEEGLPTYIILIDALLLSSGDNADLLLAAAELNGAYAAAFDEDPQHRKSLSAKALRQALKGSCLKQTLLCDIESKKYDEVVPVVATIGEKNIEVLYALARAWAGWIHAHADEMQAVAQLSSVRLLIERVVELDELYDFGSPHMYMGMFESLLPPALGGRPEVAKVHFQRAIDISEGRNLYAKVLYAQSYARLVYDRELHDRLLNEVVEANPLVESYTLQNTVAQKLAHELLDDADEYF